MKIALMVRGPIRPHAQSVSEVIDHYLGIFKDHEVDVFLGTWNSENLEVLRDIRPNFNQINLIAFNELSKELIESELLVTKCRTAQRYPSFIFPHNTYKQFWMCRELIKTIVTYKRFDRIVYTRTDMMVTPEKLEDWLLEDKVCTIAPSEGVYPDDRFAIATPEVMRKSFEFRDLQNLNTTYANSENAENCWFQIMNQNGASHKGCSVTKAELIR